MGSIVAMIWTLALVVVAAVINAVFTLYMVPMILYLIRGNGALVRSEESNPSKLYIFTILVPLYNEHLENIKPTVNSIISQKYPREMVEVIFIVERKDEETRRACIDASNILKEKGFKSKVIFSKNSERKGKAYALNTALDYVSGDIVVVFDADDFVDPHYLTALSGAFSKDNIAAITAKVYRENHSVHGKLLALDTVLWYDVILPSLVGLGGYAPLSGEGLAVKTNIIKEIGGFPEGLTEDAMLSLELALKGYKMKLLGNKPIYEKAPRTLRSHIRQRIRWFQGYYECLLKLLKQARDLGPRKFLSLLISYMAPLAAIATMISHTIFVIYWFSWFTGLDSLKMFVENIYVGPLFYWSLALLVLGNIFLLFMYLYLIGDTKFEDTALEVFLTPIYWYLNGLIALAALFKPKVWWKTER